MWIAPARSLSLPRSKSDLSNNSNNKTMTVRMSITNNYRSPLHAKKPYQFYSVSAIIRSRNKNSLKSTPLEVFQRSLWLWSLECSLIEKLFLLIKTKEYKIDLITHCGYELRNQLKSMNQIKWKSKKKVNWRNFAAHCGYEMQNGCLIHFHNIKYNPYDMKPKPWKSRTFPKSRD